MRRRTTEQRLTDNVVVFDRSRQRFALIQHALESRGFNATQVTSAEDALAAAETQLPSLLVIFIDRAPAEKLDLCRQIRDNSATQEVALLAIAATHAIAVTALAAGADDYIVFPLQPMDLATRAHATILRARIFDERSVVPGFAGQFRMKRELMHRISDGLEFALFHVDLDHFRAFNRRYGSSQGDDAIRFLGAVLKLVAVKFDGAAIVSHLWADHFAILTTSITAENMAKAIVSDFEVRSPRLYDNSDLRRRAIEVVERRGGTNIFPLMSVSVGATTSNNAGVGSEAEAREVAEELRLRAKKTSGSAYAIDRRMQ